MPGDVLTEVNVKIKAAVHRRVTPCVNYLLHLLRRHYRSSSTGIDAVVGAVIPRVSTFFCRTKQFKKNVFSFTFDLED